MSEYQPKLVHLPGTRLSPEVVLHRTLAKIEHIKAVAVVIQWQDDSFEADWSALKISELCMAALLFTDAVRKVATGEDGA